MAGKRKHISLKIPQKLEIISRFEIGKSWGGVVVSYNIGLQTVCDIKKLWLYTASSESVKDLFKQQVQICVA